MRTGFRNWMLVKEEGSMHTTGMYTPQGGSMAGSPSQQGFQMNTPQSAPQSTSQPASNIPWQMNNFKNWYNGNRGSWNDVVKAAQTNPQVRTFMTQLSKELVTGPFQAGPAMDDDGGFDTETSTKLGTLADRLEAMVKQVIPQHGDNQYDPISPMQRRQAQGVPSSSRGPNAKTRSDSPSLSQLKDMQSRVQSDPDKTQLISVVRTLMLRIDDIERRLQTITPAA